MADLVPMRRRYVQRADGGFDFYNGDQKTTIDEYVKATGRNGSDLRQELAARGDTYSQNVIRNDRARLNPTVQSFNNTDVNAQRKQLYDLQGLANRNVFKSQADVRNAEWARQQLADIELAGIKKTGNPLTLWGDIIKGTGDTAGRLVNPIVNTAQAESRGADLSKLYNSGQITKEEFNAASQNVLKDNISLRVDTNADGSLKTDANGFIQSRKANPFEFLVDTAQRGADAGLTFSPVGAGYKQVAALGAKAAAPQIAKAIGREGAAYTAANTANDVLQGRGITAESLLTNAATSFGGAAIGAGTALAPRAAKATPEALKTANTAIERAVNPQVRQIDETIQNYQRAFDVETNPTRRRQINEGLAQLNSERRALTQGGYIGNRSSNVPDDASLQSIQSQSKPEIRQQQTPIQRIESQANQANIPVQGLVPDNQRFDSSYGNGSTNGGISQPLTELPPQRQTRFASQTAPSSGNLSPELARAVRENAASYSRSTNAGSVDESINFLKSRTEDEAVNDVFSRLGQQNIDRQTVTDAIATASSLDNRGGTRNLELAQQIYDQLSEKLTKAGQTVQAASIISRRTPEGMTYNALRELQRANVPVTPEIRKAISDKTNEIGKLKLGSERREIGVAELQREVNKLIPDELVDKIVGTWKAGLLTGIRTTTGGALSNALFRALREVSRPGAVLADMAVSALGGKRSVALTQRGNWSGTKEGLQKAGAYLKSGIDERSFTADGKYIDREINFGNNAAGKALGTYVNGVFRIMGAADRPFYYSQFKNSLYEATIVEAKNLKLKGKDFDDYVINGIKNPSQEATQYATRLAEQSVLGNDTLLSNIANKLREAAEKQENKAVRVAAKATLGVLAPFTKVPSAFLSRVIDFTPIGAVKEAAMQIANKRLDQAKLVQAISESATGTGLIYLGMELANNDMLSGNYPNDPKEQARWKAEGITPNSIKVGDRWYSLNYAGPLGAIFGVGKSITDAAKEGGNPYDAALAGATQLATGTLEQSFLSGVSGALDAIQDPGRYAANFARSQAGSIIPTILNDIGNTTDPVKRQANNPLEAIQARIPGARTGLLEQTDSLGRPVKQPANTPFDLMINPLRPSKSVNSPVTDELDRLKGTNKENFVFPTVDKTIQQSGETVELTPEQRKTYNDRIGTQINTIYGNIINNENYKTLSDEQKAETLRTAARDISAVEKEKMLRELGRYDLADKVKLNDAQRDIAGGSVSGQSAINKGGSEGRITISNKIAKSDQDVLRAYNNLSSQEKDNYFYNSPDAEYKYNLAKYQNDKAEGKVKEVDRIKTEKSLKKDQVGSKFQKDVRDFYGLSKDDIYSYVTQAKDGDALAKQLIAYDRALYDSGVTSSLKFKGGVIAQTATRSSGGRRRSSSGRGGSNDTTVGKALLAAKKATSQITTKAKQSDAPPSAPKMQVAQKQQPLRKYQVAGTRTSGIKQA